MAYYKIYINVVSVADYLASFQISLLYKKGAGWLVKLSDLHNQEAGVPQGSILSVTLFILKNR